MNWNIEALKRLMWTILLGSSLVIGLATSASAQNPYWNGQDYSKRHQKEEKREMKRHQKFEREEFGNSAELRRHQKEEQRELKRHQKREKKGSDWRYRY